MKSKITGDTSYELSEIFPVEKERVFKSFMDAEVLKKIWFIEDIVIDARVGGKSRAKAEYQGENRDFILTYKEIVPNEKLRWVINFLHVQKNETRNTVSFKSVPGGTQVTLCSENLNTEIDVHMQAWKWALASLGELLQK
jgi:uncharacterized protein YndB with AHSA1/START domain